ncbi:hypothetical protein JCM8547_002088 [Rhodosporidiobolus lusitaniae]
MSSLAKDKANPTIEMLEHDKGSTTMHELEEDDGIIAVLQNGDTFKYTKEEEKKALRRLDWNLLSLIFVVETLAYVDRGNFGNAKTAGMAKSLDLSSHQYTLLLQIYYVFYLSFQFLLLGWKIIPPNIYAAVMALGWGITSMAQAGAQSWGALLACRAFMGLFEAGFIPGVALYMSFFYRKEEIGLRYCIFISTAALGGVYSGALAYGLVQAKTALESWQLLFVVEGIPTIIMVPIIYFFLAPAPGRCRYLNDRQNAIIKARLGTSESGSSGREQGVKVDQILPALQDPISYLYAAMVFCVNMAFSSFPVFLPTILTDMGYTSILAQGYSAAPYAVSFFACIGMCFLSDKLNHRGSFFAACTTIGGVGFVLMCIPSEVGVRYFGTFVCASGLYAAVPLVFVWLMNNNGDESRRGAGLALFGTIGQLGPLPGLTLYPADEAPRYYRGMFASAGVLWLAAGLAILTQFWLRRVNKRRDREAERSVSEGGDVADLNSFRFTL